MDGRILVGRVEGNEACEVMVITGLPLTVVVDAPAWPAGEVVTVPVELDEGWLTSRVEVGTHAFGSLDDDDDVDNEPVASALAADEDRVVVVSVESPAEVVGKASPAVPVATPVEEAAA